MVDLNYHNPFTFLKSFNQDKRIKLNEPKDMEIDNNDNIYITDTKNYKIIKFNSSGRFCMSFGLPGNKPWQLQEPTGLAIDDRNGDIWVTDTGNHKIKKFDSHGNFQKVIDGQFYTPRDLAIDRYGNIYVCDTGNGVIKKYNHDYDFVKQWECNTFLFSNYMLPYYIKVDNNEVYVSDIGSLRIIVFSSEGKYLREIYLKPFLKYYSNEIYFYIEDNTILVTDTVNNKIMRFDKNGKILNDIKKDSPTGIIKNSRDEIIFGDILNKTLNVIYF
jgi:DNA-binding beta-propeller fold protein YncE